MVKKEVALNSYMDLVVQEFKELPSKDYILDNMDNLLSIIEELKQFLSKKYIEDKSNTSNNISLNDIYTITNSIIESINPSWVKDFNNVRKNKNLKIYMKNNYRSNDFTIYEDLSKTIRLNITNSYTDIIDLVHEFSHYMSCKEYDNYVYEFFREFIAIYFELFATDYLVNNGYDISKELYNNRLYTTKESVNDLSVYVKLLLSYIRCGQVDWNFINSNISKISLREYDYGCTNLLNDFEEVKLLEQKQKYICIKYLDVISLCFEYVIGTMLAFYAYRNIDLNIMIEFSEKINEFKTIDEALNFLNIKLDKELIEKTFESINEHLDSYSVKRR